MGESQGVCRGWERYCRGLRAPKGRSGSQAEATSGLSNSCSSYKVITQEFMRTDFTALTKDAGFQEVLSAVTSMADPELPVVDSTGRVGSTDRQAGRQEA